AAMGRLVGEGGAPSTFLTAGGYALAGAAAFSGAATHTLSPALLATLLANAVGRHGRRPSFYDNIPLSKRLPPVSAQGVSWVRIT
ncbi:hypothetical protein NHX12_009557, partial [Muraenolepis orangiensis]